jgi:peptidoglycan/xylan/chitin deacetylase (PgdA/CDA1 family)
MSSRVNARLNRSFDQTFPERKSRGADLPCIPSLQILAATRAWSSVDTLVCASTLALATAAVIAYGVRAPSSQLFGSSVFHGDSSRRSLALTFDDGPSPGTSRLLDLLDHYQVPATFFQCGANVQRHPSIARDVLAAGHEIGNHTFSHARLCPRLGWKLNLLSGEAIYQEFAITQQVIKDATGFRPRHLRAPYGLRWFGIAEAQRRLDLLGVMWTVIGHDWEWPSARIADLILKRSSPGGILCLHDGRDIRANPDISETIAAVRSFVPILKEQGYTFETVTNILTSVPLHH